MDSARRPKNKKVMSKKGTMKAAGGKERKTEEHKRVRRVVSVAAKLPLRVTRSSTKQI